MKYKVGDRVKIQSLDWYNENKDEYGDVPCGEFDFVESMKKFCSETFTISDDDGDAYLMLEEDKCMWTDEMIEGLVEEETKPEPKFKVGDKIISDVFTTKDDKGWKVINVERTGYKLISVNNPDLICDIDFKNEQYYKLVEDETPKFKVNDIVCVKNIGWVRITNSYWDSLANEYIYEAIGFNGRGEYDNINQSNIECQMLPESENPHTGEDKITLDEYKNNDKEWLFNKLAMLDNITALESIQDIFNHLQQPKYPKTYEECCKVINYALTGETIIGYKASLLRSFQKLLICRDAYWKIAGDEMGLGKPWEPDYTNTSEKKFSIWVDFGEIKLGGAFTTTQMVLSFPTAEMRDAFYENFKEEIEICKELL